MKIACCGLDCSKCKAFEATKNNDDKLRESVAKEWSDLNKVEIKPSDINCMGCNECGVKFPFCDHMCPIRICARQKNFNTCAECELIDTCDKVKMVIGNNKEALNNLKSLNKK